MFLRFFLILATVLNVANLSSFGAAAADSATTPAPQSITIRKEELMGHFTKEELKTQLPKYSNHYREYIVGKDDVKDENGVLRKVRLDFYCSEMPVKAVLDGFPDRIVFEPHKEGARGERINHEWPYKFYDIPSCSYIYAR